MWEGAEAEAGRPVGGLVSGPWAVAGRVVYLLEFAYGLGGEGCGERAVPSTRLHIFLRGRDCPLPSCHFLQWTLPEALADRCHRGPGA